MILLPQLMLRCVIEFIQLEFLGRNIQIKKSLKWTKLSFKIQTQTVKSELIKMYQRLIVGTMFICIFVLNSAFSRVNALCCRNRFTVVHPCGAFPTERRTVIKSKCSSLLCMDGHIYGAFFCSLGDCDITGCHCDEPCITNKRGSWKEAKRLFSEYYEVPVLN